MEIQNVSDMYVTSLILLMHCDISFVIPEESFEFLTPTANYMSVPENSNQMGMKTSAN